MAGVWRSQNSFIGGIYSEKMHGRVELEGYQNAVADMFNAKVMPHGGFTRRTGTKFAWECKGTDRTRIIEFQYSSGDTYILEVGDEYMRFGKNGSQIEDGGTPVELITPWPETEVFELHVVQSADVMWICHPSYRPYKLLRYSDTEWYLDPVAFVDGPYLPLNTTGVTLVSSAASGTGVTITAANGATITNVSIGWKGLLPIYTRVTCSTGHGLKPGDTVTIAGVTGFTALNGTWTVENAGETQFDVNLVYTGGYTGGGTLSADVFASTDVGRLVRIFESGGSLWSWAEITAYTNAWTVTADIVSANPMPIVATTQWRLGKFSDTTGWPASVSLYELRNVYGGAEVALQDVDFSQTDAFDYFETAPDGNILDSDAMAWSLFSGEVDTVEWMYPTRAGLAVGTNGGCWIMTGAGGQDQPMTPTSINAKKHTYIPVHRTIQPKGFDNAVLFVDKEGKRLHEFAYLWQEDSYRAPDLIVLADDLTLGKLIYDVAAQRVKKHVWMVLNDGSFLGLTYMRAEGIVAWHRHELATTDSDYPVAVKSVAAAVESDSKEIVYFVTQRRVNGSLVQYVEYMEEDNESGNIEDEYFLDCGITDLASPADTTVTGLDHLEGEPVWALVDGKVVKTASDGSALVVSGGSITLPYAGSTRHVGINFFSDVESLPLEAFDDGRGSTIGRVKDLGKTAIKVTRSYGAKIGRSFDEMTEVLFNEDLVVGGTPEYFSGEKAVDKMDGNPDTDVRICIRQDVPLPLTVNAVVTRFDTTEM